MITCRHSSASQPARLSLYNGQILESYLIDRDCLVDLKIAALKSRQAGAGQGEG
jgi:hypothetical protein